MTQTPPRPSFQSPGSHPPKPQSANRLVRQSHQQAGPNPLEAPDSPWQASNGVSPLPSDLPESVMLAPWAIPSSGFRTMPSRFSRSQLKQAALPPISLTQIRPSFAPTTTHSKPPLGFKRLARFWSSLNLRTKLTVFLMLSAALPTLVVTQGLVAMNRSRALQDARTLLAQQGETFRDEYVLWTQTDSETAAANLAQLIQATGINLSNPLQVLPRRQALQTYVRIENGSDPEINHNFKILTDRQGRSIVQDIQTLTPKPQIPKTAEEASVIAYQAVNAPVGLNLAALPIVQAAIAARKPLSGVELLDQPQLQQLGLAEAAQLQTDGKPATQALVTLAVHPIEVNGQMVGTVVLGTLLNNYHPLADVYQTRYEVSNTAVFAKEQQIITTQGDGNGQRLKEIQAPSEATSQVLGQQQDLLQTTKVEGQNYLHYYSPVYDHRKTLTPNQAPPVGMVLVGKSLKELEGRFLNQQLIAYGLGGGMLFLAGLMAIPAAGSIASPLRKVSLFTQQVGTGKRRMRLDPPASRDEIGLLTVNLNQMLHNLELQETRLSRELTQSRILSEVATLRNLENDELLAGLSKALETARLFLGADRLVVYRCAKGAVGGQPVAEAVQSGWPSAIALRLSDSCIPVKRLEDYRRGLVTAANDVTKVGFHTAHVKLLQSLQVKASLIVPVVTENQELFGLLVAHHCANTHEWQTYERAFMERIATQIAAILDYATVLEQQRQAQATLRQEQEKLQRRALELLMEVDPVSRGDLTVRATVTEDEIGTVADSYNSTIESLRKIVVQVQGAATEVATTTSVNETAIQSLAREAIQQAEEITQALGRIQSLSQSVEAIAANATQAQIAVQQTTQTVQSGDAAMTRAVNGMLAIRETVSETTKKMQGLGDASNRISQVVQLIANFAAQTHMLALKASIEAARAGEQGQGFAVIAEEVRLLASQSAQASADIEAMIGGIQTATQEVLSAMQVENEQVAVEVQLVDETRASLNQITRASAQVNQLVGLIAKTTVDQTRESGAVAHTMTDMARVVRQTSQEATQVAASFKQLLTVAQALQSEVERFKVK